MRVISALINCNIFTIDEYAVCWDNAARLEYDDITYNQFIDANCLSDTELASHDSNHLLSDFVCEFDEASILVPIVEGTERHYKCDSDINGDALDPAIM